MAILLLVAVLAACGAEPAPDTVDTGALDSGNYPTAPQPVNGGNAFEDAVFREGSRLGGHVPLLHEIDPELTFGRGWPGLISTAERLPSSTVWPRKATTETPGFVVGWSNEARRRRDSSAGRSLLIYVLRFDSEPSAARAAQTLSAARLTEPGTQPLPVPDEPSARGVWKPSETQRSASYSAWAAHQQYVLFAHVYDPLSVPPDRTAGAALLAKALTKQADYLTGYRPTALPDIRALPADTDSMLARALPRDGKPDTRSDPPGVYSVRAAAAYAHDPAETVDALRAAGTDLVAISGSTVARTRDAAAARGLVDRFSKRLPEDLAPAPPPPGLPGAKCVTQQERTRGDRAFLPRYLCYLAYARYYAMVGGANQQDTYQRTAAQYKILTNAK